MTTPTVAGGQTSNLSSWIKGAGLDGLADKFSDPSIDTWATIIGVAVFLVSLGVLIRPWRMLTTTPTEKQLAESRRKMSSASIGLILGIGLVALGIAVIVLSLK